MGFRIVPDMAIGRQGIYYLVNKIYHFECIDQSIDVDSVPEPIQLSYYFKHPSHAVAITSDPTEVSIFDISFVVLSSFAWVAVAVSQCS